MHHFQYATSYVGNFWTLLIRVPRGWKPDRNGNGLLWTTQLIRSLNRVAGDIPAMREAMNACCAEAIKVARARGIRLPAGHCSESYVCQATDAHSYEHRSSMCLDLEARRRTEVDVMNGAIERFGQEVGIATPINSIFRRTTSHRTRKSAMISQPGFVRQNRLVAGRAVSCNSVWTAELVWSYWDGDFLSLPNPRKSPFHLQSRLL